jgi:lysyl-tRNA synthetase class 2
MNQNDDNDINWQPTSDYKAAKKRQAKLNAIRSYFSDNEVVEVDTPILSTCAVSDINIESIQTTTSLSPEQPYYLHTSPEFFMKRMLASGYKDIFQICKVFRDDEVGKLHSPEFTMIEWYRLDFNLLKIINDTVAVISVVLDKHSNQLQQSVEIITYQDSFLAQLNIDPLSISIEEIISQMDIDDSLQQQLGNNRNQYLDYLYATRITKKFDPNKITTVTHYPASQAALARICPNDKTVAERFEIFIGNVEIANGYVELTDFREARNRFNSDQSKRHAQNKTIRPLDQKFLAAMESGLPNCAGVALGFDRLLMISEYGDSIQSVQQFTIE